MDLFDAIFVINLPERHDRKEEMLKMIHQFSLVSKQGAPVFFPAIRPKELGEWPSIGAKGCFMSHLEVLKQARARNYRDILVLEDDCELASCWQKHYQELLQWKTQAKWDIAFLGNYLNLPASASLEMVKVPKEGMRTTHFLCFNSCVFDRLINFLENVTLRKRGHTEGGPQHFDGALNMFVWQNPDINAYAANPSLATQRSSKSDVTPSLLDRLPVVKHLVGYLRKLKNTQDSVF